MINPTLQDNSLLFYLYEMRKRLIRSLLVLMGFFLVLFYFANQVYTLLAIPILQQLPHGHGLISTNVVAPFFVPFELTFVGAFCLAMPYFLYQGWAFVAPALYAHEKKIIWPFLVTSILLFYAGIAFAYWLVLPIIFRFLINTAPVGVMVSPDMSSYLDFTLQLLLTFGLTFEIPIVITVLVWTQIVKRETFSQARPYVIVGAFVVAMLLGPPDVISQTLLAIPLWILFEIGLYFSRFFE